MNRVYKHLWSARLGGWVVAHERSRSQSRRRAGTAGGVIPAAIALALSGPAAAAPPQENQLPTGGQVAAGNVGITQDGARMDVNQSSARAVVNWNTFDVGAQAQVNFAQPGRDSVILNRVLDSNPSRIYGKVTANGQVFLTNPGGIYFSPGASVEVGGLVATTHAIDDASFMAGGAALERAGASGSVINEGSLKAALGGYIALLAPEVRNAGVIVAQAGTVAMAAGERISLHFEGGSTLAGIQVTPSQIRALVENRQAVLAPGGLIVLSARAAEALQGGVVNNSGRIEANGLAMRGGKIVLEASDRIENSGSIRADAAGAATRPDGTEQQGGPAGSVTLTAPVIINRGILSAAASAAAPGNGGQVTLQAGEIVQQAGGRIDVSAYAPAAATPTSAVLPAATTMPAQGAAAQQDLQPPAAPPVTAGEVTLSAAQDIALEGEILARGEEGAAPEASPLAAAFGGSILIGAGGDIRMQGAVLDASGAAGGGRIHAEGGKQLPQAPAGGDHPDILLGGTTQLRAGSRRGHGGSATVTGHAVSLEDDTRIDAVGDTGGGLIQVGGSWQGQDLAVAQALRTTVARGVTLDASAGGSGDGGSVVVWSDIRAGASATRVYGTLLARGGSSGGAGGRVETSGHWLDVAGVSVSAAAPAGVAGLWLIDPYNVIIAGAGAAGTGYSDSFVPGADSTILASDIASALQGGNDVTITTGTNGGSVGDITVSSAIDKSSGNTDVTLTLKAANSIVVDQAISNSGGTGKLHVILDADNDNNVRDGAGIILLNQSISTGGGDIQFGTGATLSINGVTTLVGGDVYVGGGSAVTLATGGGAVTVNGEMIVANSGGMTINSANGNVTFGGQLNSGNSYQFVSASVQWNTAYGAAKSGTGAATGDTYLATITSRLENAVAARAGNYAESWLGGHRGASDGATASYDQNWRWVTGPEGLANAGTGTVFYTQTGSGAGTAASGLYAVWNPGEPNNCTATVCGGTNYGISDGESATMFSGMSGLWNDKPDGIGRAAGDSLFSYTRETNLAASALSVNAGTGTVTFAGAVGSRKSLASLGVTAASIAVNGGAVTTEGAQTYSGTVTLGSASTTLKQTAANSDLVVGSNIQKTTGGTASLILQATRDIVLNSGVSIASTGGALNVVLNSDSDGTGGGAVLLKNNTAITTSGGSIAIGGGTAGDASGEARGATTANQIVNNVQDEIGVRFGTSVAVGTNSNISLNSAGGNISIRGRGGSGSNHNDVGVLLGAGTTIDSGTGTLSIHGYGGGSGNGSGHGIDLAYGDASYGVKLTSANTTAGAITIAGDATGSTKADRYGIQAYFGSDKNQIAATGAGGGLNISGLSNANWGIGLNNVALLAASGPIVVNSGTQGMQSISGGGQNGAIRLGASSAAGSLVTSSTADIELNGDRFTAGASGIAVTSSGTLTLQSAASSFSSAWSSSGWNFGTTLTGLTLGKAGNTANLTLSTAVSVAGPVSVHAGRWTQSASLSATTASGITLRARDDIILNSGSGLSSAGGAIILNSDVDGGGTGGITINGSTIASNGGNIVLGGGSAGDGSGYARGLTDYTLYNNYVSGDALPGNIAIAIGNSSITAGGGNISMKGQASAGNGATRAKGIEIFGRTGWTTAISTTGSGTLGFDGIGYANSGGINYGFNITNSSGAGVTSISSQNGAIAITGTGGSAGNNNSGIMLEGVSGTITIASTGGGISLNGTAGTGASGWGIASSGIVSVGGASTSGNIALNADTVSLDGTWRSTGALAIAPLTAGTGIGIAGGAGTLALSAANFATHFVDGFSGITVGNSSAGAITLGGATTFNDSTTLQSNAAISLNGAVTANENLALSGNGAISQSAALAVTGTTALAAGSANHLTLTNAANNFGGAVSIASANNVSLIDSDTISLGAITASGTINIATLAGNLTLAGHIQTTDATAGAIVLNAGRNAAAGTATGGNILHSSGTLNTGAGGRATLYTGSLSGSTGLVALAGAGSGRFRYDSDETAISYSTGLGSGIHVIYREQVSLTITANDATAYPQSQPYAGGNGVVYSGFINGDDAAALGGSPVYTGSSQGAQAPGVYDITPSGLASNYGYTLVYVSGTLTLNEPVALQPPPIVPPPLPQPPLASMPEPVIETPSATTTAETGGMDETAGEGQEEIAGNEAAASDESAAETVSAGTAPTPGAAAALPPGAAAEPATADAETAPAAAVPSASADTPQAEQPPRGRTAAAPLAEPAAPDSPAAVPLSAPVPASLPAALAGADSPSGAIDGLASARVDQAIAAGMDPALAQQGGQAYSETLANLLSQGMEMGAAVARAGQAFDAQTAGPGASAMQDLAAGGETAGAGLDAVSGATTAEGSAAFDRALAANLARGMPMAQALQAARAAVLQTEALARADASPQAMLANGNLAAQLQNTSPAYQQALGTLLAKGVSLQEAMQRAEALAQDQAAAAGADARNPAVALSTGNAAALPGRSEVFDSALQAALGRGMSMSEALQFAQRTETDLRLAAEADARNPAAALSGGQAASINGGPAFDRALSSGLAKGLTPAAALERARQADSAAAAPEGPAAALASGKGVEAMLAGGTSRIYRTTLNNALARGMAPEKAIALAKQAEQTAQADKGKPTRVILRSGTQRVTIEIPDAAPR